MTPRRIAERSAHCAADDRRVALYPVAELGRQKFPLPFGRIYVTVHHPIAVNSDNFENAGRLIAVALGGGAKAA